MKAPLLTEKQVNAVNEDELGYGIDEWLKLTLEEQRDADHEYYMGLMRERVIQIETLAVKAVLDEPEFLGDMPDELWGRLNGDRAAIQAAMSGMVRLTKEGITERFQQALDSHCEEGK